MNRDLVSYYKDRAEEYEKIYSKSERQDDLQSAAVILQDLFSEKAVLEIACGTGYWTERIAETAALIDATDINGTVIEIARKKHYKSKVAFSVVDFWDIDPGRQYECVFGGFIWSHILLHDIGRFIDKLKSFVVPGGNIVFKDNKYVEGSSHPITKTDEYGNTYQVRKLENGSSHMVLKNFPSEDLILRELSRVSAETKFTDLAYYWIASCKL